MFAESLILNSQSPEMLETIRTIEMVACTDVTLLINGEYGSGKKKLAEIIHARSTRKSNSFKRLCCRDISEEKLRVILDDKQNHPANEEKYEDLNGTLFFQDVNDLSLDAQAVLLSYLASNKNDFRIIASSNEDLFIRVSEGRFRKDLFYLLNIVPVDLPPLRNRSEDLMLLINAIFQELVREYRLSPPSITDSAFKKLKQYPWPGNLCELHTFCQRVLILLPGKSLDVQNLPSEIIHFCQPVAHNPFVLPVTGIDLDKVEKDLILQAVKHTRGNKTHAARLLGLTRDTLLYRIKKHMIES